MIHYFHLMNRASGLGIVAKCKCLSKERRRPNLLIGDQNEGIWGDIIGGGFSSSEKVSSVSFDKGASLNSETKNASVTPLNDELLADLPSLDDTEEHTSSEQKGFLQNCHFYIHGFSSKQVCAICF